jgi:acyl carrier protein
VDVIVLVDQEFGFKMRPEQFRDLKTYGQFCQFIADQVG